MPPLRDRIEDLPELAQFFLRRYNLKFRKNIHGIADSTLKILGSYWWPGNIRELENLIERLVAISDKEWITDEDLPYEFHVAQLDASGPATENLLERAVSTFERNFIIRALEKSAWNVTATARSARHPAQHAEIQDGPARDPGAGPQDPGQRDRPSATAQTPAQSAKKLAALRIEPRDSAVKRPHSSSSAGLACPPRRILCGCTAHRVAAACLLHAKHSSIALNSAFS